MAATSRYECSDEALGLQQTFPQQAHRAARGDTNGRYTPAPSTSRFRDAIHPVQFGIFPNRLLLPHPDDEMLSGSEEDVSSIRDGYTVWVMVDLASILERHLVISNSAKPIFREAQDRRHSSPNPECFNNDVLKSVTRAEEAQHFDLESGTSTRERRCH